MASCANTFLEQIAAYLYLSMRDVFNISNQTTNLPRKAKTDFHEYLDNTIFLNYLLHLKTKSYAVLISAWNERSWRFSFQLLSITLISTANSSFRRNLIIIISLQRSTLVLFRLLELTDKCCDFTETLKIVPK